MCQRITNDTCHVFFLQKVRSDNLQVVQQCCCSPADIASVLGHREKVFSRKPCRVIFLTDNQNMLSQSLSAGGWGG